MRQIFSEWQIGNSIFVIKKADEDHYYSGYDWTEQLSKAAVYASVRDAKNAHTQGLKYRRIINGNYEIKQFTLMSNPVEFVE